MGGKRAKLNCSILFALLGFTGAILAQGRDSVRLEKRDHWYAPVKDISLGSTHLDVNFNLRMRYEHTKNFDVRGYGSPGTDELLLLRTRLGLDWRVMEYMLASLEMQDARYWLSDLNRDLWPENNPFLDEIDLRQAYVEWKKIGGTPLGFKIGRQIITYADERVFGPGEWANSGRYCWDGAKLCFSGEVLSMDLIYG
ncbi:MAG: alginate export family protein, partial [Kiritimatiellae bacterium]|nr:alginate export family protein [Kiritimatiellia bacterium]